MMDRRIFLGATAATGLTLAAPSSLAFGRADTSRRFVFVIQRGGADGLAALAPVGEPAFAALRGGWRDDYSGHPLVGGLFALHPSLQRVRELFGRGEALFLHATATGYRERSHFEAQKVLENGGTRGAGWLNRLLGLLPADQAGALALASTLPLALSGPNPAANYTPSRVPLPSDDLLARVASMYDGDELLQPLWQRARTMQQMGRAMDPARRGGGELGARAAAFLQPREGARIAVVETGGWDTHASQPVRLAHRLADLDDLISSLERGLGSAWRETVVLVATEFGRTARANGTNGTDHGTGSLAMLLGGAVQGGRLVGDWPGISPSALFQERDLRPTSALETFVGGVLAEHFRLDPEIVRRQVFPSAQGRPMDRLVR